MYVFVIVITDINLMFLYLRDTHTTVLQIALIIC